MVKELKFGDVYQLVLTDGSKGAEVIVIYEKKEIVDRVCYYNPSIKKIWNTSKRNFLEHYEDKKRNISKENI